MDAVDRLENYAKGKLSAGDAAGTALRDELKDEVMDLPRNTPAERTAARQITIARVTRLVLKRVLLVLATYDGVDATYQHIVQ